MANKRQDENPGRMVDAGRAESEKYEPSDEVKREFAEASQLGSGRQQLVDDLLQHHSKGPDVSGGDIDADWGRSDVGEEAVGGSAPTPDQDVVEEVGEALGITYHDNEPLQGTEKIIERDRRRWELDPASSEDYNRRVNREGE